MPFMDSSFRLFPADLGPHRSTKRPAWPSGRPSAGPLHPARPRGGGGEGDGYKRGGVNRWYFLVPISLIGVVGPLPFRRHNVLAGGWISRLRNPQLLFISRYTTNPRATLWSKGGAWCELCQWCTGVDHLRWVGVYEREGSRPSPTSGVARYDVACTDGGGHNESLGEVWEETFNPFLQTREKITKWNKNKAAHTHGHYIRSDCESECTDVGLGVSHLIKKKLLKRILSGPGHVVCCGLAVVNLAGWLFSTDFDSLLD